jgi:phospholipase/lecithinase/hemolysin
MTTSQSPEMSQFRLGRFVVSRLGYGAMRLAGPRCVRPSMSCRTSAFLRTVDNEIILPNGTGAEAFVNAEDIASVAAATLVEPERHVGAAYAQTGPESLTVDEAAQIISAAAGRTIVY